MSIRRTIEISILFLLAAALYAGDRSNVRGLGMGRTFVAWSRGTDALGINPANLATPASSSFTLSLMPVGVRLSTDLLSYNLYQDYFTGVPSTNPDGKRDPKYLTDNDKSNILSSIPEGLSTTRLDLEAMEFGVTIATDKLGSIGFAMIERAGATVKMPRDYVRFMLYGLDSATSKYVFDGTGVTAWWWREYNFSYAMHFQLEALKVQELYVGFGVKMLRGYGSFETDHYTASIGNARLGTNQYLLNAQFDYSAHRSGADFLDNDKKTDFSPFPDPAGTGIGIDLGVSVQIFLGLFVAASLTDIGSISWEKNLLQTDGHYSISTDDPFSTTISDSLDRAARGVNHPIQRFSTSLPTMLRIGASVESRNFDPLKSLPGSVVFAFDYSQGLNSSMGNVTAPRLSFGMEYRLIDVLPIRTGLSMGGGNGVKWAAGFGLDFHYVSLDVATENLGILLSPKSTQMVSAAAGLTLRF